MDVLKLIEKPKDKRFLHLENMKFNRLKVIYYAGKWGKDKRKSHYWYCLCECGTYKVIAATNLKQENVKSCGCKSSRKENLVGERFGKLIVLSENENTTHKRVRWNCLCDCGNYTVTTSNNLKSNKTKSCGCLQKENTSKARFKDITGFKFGRLTVIERATMDHQPKWLCACECGEKTIARGLHLKSGHTKSCGCLLKESRIKNIQNVPIKYGKEHHSYNPTITDEERIKKRTLFAKELSDWKNKVFARDDYTCKCCNKRGSNLNAHHLNSYHWAKEERFDINNGITLCVICHKNFHKKYGMKNNTKEQFKEYIKLTNI